MATDDARALLETVTRNAAFLREWLDTPDRITSLDAAALALAQTRRDGSPARYGAFANKDLLASVKVIEVQGDDTVVELGVWVAQHAMGQGLGKWMLQNVISLVFKGSVETVALAHAPANRASMRLLLSLGAQTSTGSCIPTAQGKEASCVHLLRKDGWNHSPTPIALEISD